MEYEINTIFVHQNLTSMKKTPIVSLAFLCLIYFTNVGNAHAQLKDSTAHFAVSGYLDAYYAHYSDSVGVNNFQQFPYIN